MNGCRRCQRYGMPHGDFNHDDHGRALGRMWDDRVGHYDDDDDDWARDPDEGDR